MPSLGQKVFGYFRQLSFIAEPKEEIKHNQCFVTKFLQSSTDEQSKSSSKQLTSSLTQIYSGKQPNDLPELELRSDYDTGVNTIRIAITGPDEGLTFCRRSRIHLSAEGEIDFIDDKDEEVRHNPKRFPYPRKLSNVSRKSSHQPEMTSTTTKASSLKPSDFKQTTDEENNETELVAGVCQWNTPSTDHGYGVAISLYEKNPITNENVGSPIADCFGMIARKDSCVLAMGDGVNWGLKSKIASCSAVQASMEYLSRALFSSNNIATNTNQIFVSLLRSFWEAQDFILEAEGHLTTLTVAVILPLADSETHKNKYVCCSCNVGDSLGYVYSKKHGVREFTLGSHDITNNRDMRDALGALGPVDGKNPELNNLTLSMTVVEKGDIVFLTSDGVSDNFDPVVGKFAEVDSEPTCVPEPELSKNELIPKRQNKSASSIQSSRRKHDLASSSTSSFSSADVPIRPPRTKKSNLTTASISKPMPVTNEQLPIRPKYMRSKTLIEARHRSTNFSSSSSSKSSPQSQIRIKKSAAGLPIVTAFQRHALTLLRMTDLFCYGINGTLRPCTTAKKLCSLLIDFTKMITSAKRKLLEQREQFWKISYDAQGQRNEIALSRLQQRAVRKRVVDQHFSSLPGKLDHASVVGWTVGIDDGINNHSSNSYNNNNNNNSDLLLDSKTKSAATYTLSTNPSNIYTETDF